ncbi:hypothetical protein SAMN05428954_1101 [Streptomyces sp. 2112.3]|nr:hypothetical protein BX261_6125 [Streptomyces sp. 2321.6]SDQ97574.1 hypothetical protein SAMN05216511_1130 [Streptomyces sp. KS_16]SED83034.1 hypothetical protein SAMN05428954_1101 [Streptomyces sp. 2112.3]SED87193.1 hypothetical protein SAMN05428940_6151 [Streptomyces sp. 2133.1]SNC72936.1 hypothetical protein SAMN06272741_6051 [Streptomyces sp. 2114.4]
MIFVGSSTSRPTMFGPAHRMARYAFPSKSREGTVWERMSIRPMPPGSAFGKSSHSGDVISFRAPPLLEYTVMGSVAIVSDRSQTHPKTADTWRASVDVARSPDDVVRPYTVGSYGSHARASVAGDSPRPIKLDQTPWAPSVRSRGRQRPPAYQSLNMSGSSGSPPTTWIPSASSHVATIGESVTPLSSRAT